MKKSECGQTIPLVALLMAAMAGGMVLLGVASQAIDQSARAQMAADSIALAGAAAGRDAAEVAAKANNAKILSFEESGGDVVIRARVEDGLAVARARRDDL